MLERLHQQINFIIEIDKLKLILRQNCLIHTPRAENDAEHSWHLAMMAMLLTEYADDAPVDLLKVIKMTLIHDVIEIYAGDTFCYDDVALASKQAREETAAAQLFSLLPPDQAAELHQLWDEFEAAGSPEARFANCLDRLQPLLLNYHTKGHTWQYGDVTSEKVHKRMAILAEYAPQLWDYAQTIIQDSIDKGFLKA